MKLCQKGVEIVYRGLVIRAIQQQEQCWIAYIQLVDSSHPEDFSLLSEEWIFSTAQACLENAKAWVNRVERNPYGKHIRTSLIAAGLSPAKARLIAKSSVGFPSKAERAKMPKIWREAALKSGELYQNYGIVIWRNAEGWNWATSCLEEVHWHESEFVYSTRSKALLEARRSILTSNATFILSLLVDEWCRAGKISRGEQRSWFNSAKSIQWQRGREE